MKLKADIYKYCQIYACTFSCKNESSKRKHRVSETGAIENNYILFYLLLALILLESVYTHVRWHFDVDVSDPPFRASSSQVMDMNQLVLVHLMLATYPWLTPSPLQANLSERPCSKNYRNMLLSGRIVGRAVSNICRFDAGCIYWQLHELYNKIHNERLACFIDKLIWHNVIWLSHSGLWFGKETKDKGLAESNLRWALSLWKYMLLIEGYKAM